MQIHGRKYAHELQITDLKLWNIVGEGPTFFSGVRKLNRVAARPRRGVDGGWSSESGPNRLCEEPIVDQILFVFDDSLVIESNWALDRREDSLDISLTKAIFDLDPCWESLESESIDDISGAEGNEVNLIGKHTHYSRRIVSGTEWTKKVLRYLNGWMREEAVREEAVDQL